VGYGEQHEDDLILKLFEPGFTGRFLDIGCNDGKKFSNTYAMALAGWSGVAVDASWKVAGPWRENYKDLPNVNFVNSAIGESSGIVPFWDCDETLVSTCDEKLVNRQPMRQKSKRIWVGCITVDQLMKEFGEQYNFVSVDIEGWSIQVLRLLPFDKMNAKVICAEYLTPDYFGVDERPIVLEILGHYGYKHVATTKHNVIAVRP
jgi:FkbM family methyltransferase